MQHHLIKLCVENRISCNKPRLNFQAMRCGTDYREALFQSQGNKQLKY